MSNFSLIFQYDYMITYLNSKILSLVNFNFQNLEFCYIHKSDVNYMYMYIYCKVPIKLIGKINLFPY